MTAAKQGFPDDRDRRLLRDAEQVSRVADDLVAWAGENIPSRNGTDFEIGNEEEFALYKMRRLASNLCRSSRVPVAAAVYGASQVGKSLFVGRVLEPADERDSPLGLDETTPPAYFNKLSFEHDINPQSGSNEATALVTRFTTKERFDPTVLPEFAVKVRALTRAEWLRVVARGFRSECLQPKNVTWREGQLRSLFEEISSLYSANSIDREWRIDLLDTYAYLRGIDPRQYEATESIFNAFLSQHPLTNAGYLQLAGRMFWDSQNFPALNTLFEVVCNFIRKISANGKDGILVHWAAVKFLLDSQRSTIQQNSKSRWMQKVAWNDLKDRVVGDWYVIDYEPGAGGPSDELWTIQSAMLEMIIPVIPHRLTSDWADVIYKMDILDLPGMKAGGSDTQGGATKIESVPEKMNVVKRGKVFYLIDRYLEERQVQTLFLLVRGGNTEVRQLLKEYVDKWGKARYGDERWPRKVDTVDPALFIGLTGIDDEFKDRELNQSLYEHRLNMLVNEMLYEVMTDFGGVGKPFSNIFPIRYPGTWDFEEKRQRTSDDPTKWKRAAKIFLESPLVQKFVRNAEQRWDIAMRDDDGGLSLISRGFITCTTSEQKQNALDEQIRSLRESLLNLAESWYCDPSSNHDRQKRADVAAMVLSWIDDEQKVYERVHAIQNALCFDEGNAMQIAEFAEKRELRTSGRPEPISEHFPKFLREVLTTWAREITTRAWHEHTTRHDVGSPWLSDEQFGTFSRYLSEYLCTDAVFQELSRRLLEIIMLPIRQAGDRRFAQRAYIRVILNDFVLNPGVDDCPLEANPDDDAAASQQPAAVNGDDVKYGLMTPFVHRWNRRLSGALCSAAGDHVAIPSGNDDLREILDDL